MTRATVLVPTFDHGPTLSFSVRSALSQTVEDLEVFIVGDGVPDTARDVVAELASDERVRFFDNPKGARHGEVHRDAALRQAQGDIVCYLSDDDLWLPNHVETMQSLLSDADFANALPVYVDEKGALGFYIVDLALRADRELILSGINRVPLSCGAHTLGMYRRLPYGWRTTPEGTPTDLYMWQQFLAEPECRTASGTRPTVLHFPSPQRASWTMEERLAELDRWDRKMTEAGWLDRFGVEVLDALVRDYAAELARLRMHIARFQERRQRLEQQIQDILNSRTWKLVSKVARVRAKLVRRSRGDEL